MLGYRCLAAPFVSSNLFHTEPYLAITAMPGDLAKLLPNGGPEGVADWAHGGARKTPPKTKGWNPRLQICPLDIFGNNPPHIIPMDLNIGESRVWRLDETGQIYNPGT